jgi:hypothetical protein
MDALNEVCLRLGHFYNAYRVLQDAGIWTYNVEDIARYVFARLGLPVLD